MGSKARLGYRKYVIGITAIFIVFLAYYIFTHNSSDQHHIGNMTPFVEKTKPYATIGQRKSAASQKNKAPTMHPVIENDSLTTEAANSYQATNVSISIRMINGMSHDAMPALRLKLLLMDYEKSDSSKGYIARTDNTGSAMFTGIKRGKYKLYTELSRRNDYFTIEASENNQEITIVYDRFSQCRITMLAKDGSPIQDEKFAVETIWNEWKNSIRREYATDSNGQFTTGIYVSSGNSLLLPVDDHLLGYSPDAIDQPEVGIKSKNDIGSIHIADPIYADSYVPLTVCVGLVNIPEYYQNKMFSMILENRRAYFKNGQSAIVIPWQDHIKIHISCEVPGGVPNILYASTCDILPNEYNKDIIVDMAEGKHLTFKIVNESGEPIIGVALNVISRSVDGVVIRNIITSPSSREGIIETTIPLSYLSSVAIYDSPLFSFTRKMPSMKTGEKYLELEYAKLNGEPVKIELQKQIQLMGAVMSSGGTPIEGATVVVADNEMTIIGPYTKTDNSGKYSIFVSPGSLDHPYVISAYHHNEGKTIICPEKDESYKSIMLEKRTIERFTSENINDMHVEFISQQIHTNITPDKDPSIIASRNLGGFNDEKVWIDNMVVYGHAASPYIHITFTQK